MATDNLKTLKTRRSFLKGQQTRFANFLDEITDKSDSKIAEINFRLAKVYEWFSEFDALQYEIEELDSQNAEEHKECRKQFEDKHYALLVRAGKWLENDTVDTSSALGAVASSNRNTVTNATNPTNASLPLVNPIQFNVKLPQLSLPEFAGSYDKWSQFYDTFKSLIDNNTTLNNIQKFYYLQACLKGEAAQIIQSLEISDANYAVAWGLLKERFENKKIIIKTHLKNIFEAPNVSRDSHTALRLFLDNFLKNFRSLKNLKEPVDEWNTILIYLLVSKLDSNSRREWETDTKNTDSPKIDDFIKFLTDRCNLLESIDNKTCQLQTQQGNLNKRSHDKSQVLVSTFKSTNKCTLCNGNHYIHQCEEFNKLTISARINEIKKLKMCTNCLRKGHFSNECIASSCRICKKKHNTLLHFESKQNSGNTVAEIETNKSENTKNTNVSASASTSSNSANNIQGCPGSMAHFSNTFHSKSHKTNDNFIILSTALVYIFDNNMTPYKCRAILDNGSQSSFITLNLCKQLDLPYVKVKFPITGINSSSSNVSYMTKTKIKSTKSHFQTDIQFLVIDKITDELPQIRFDAGTLSIPSDIELADPDFNEPAEVDILLGAEIFFDLLSSGQIFLGKGKPTLQNSKLGWLVAGNLKNPSNEQHKNYCNLSRSDILHKQLEAFWLIEEVDKKFAEYSKEELECERHFVEHFKRNDDGRFVVKLPTRENSNCLRDNTERTIQRFYALERKFSRDPELKYQYTNFMNDYLQLGHMTQVNPTIPTKNSVYYLPHHGVRKDTSLTTKLRVVFDASAKSESGLSLNDVLLTGPCIQQDIISILLRFRIHNIAFTADIEKMYREILVDENDRDMQRIVWRSEPTQQLSHYRLNTVTYGTTSASFLATRCLKQLAIENYGKHPQASRSIEHDFYMDDWLGGTNDIDSARDLIRTTNKILSDSGFPLRKWIANNEDVLGEVAHCSHNSQYIIGDQNSKTLGIYWNATADHFQYKTKPKTNEIITKRNILSVVSQIFDPLGLIGPVIVISKMIIQKLWKLNLGWDEPIPVELADAWLKFFDNLHTITEICIPRLIKLKIYSHIELHLFSDSSEKAYGACAYLLTKNHEGDSLVQLICAKSRVAPLNIISLPRLELCAALLAAQLSKKILEALNANIKHTYFWSDSTIVLSWLVSDPSRFKTFVSNRISQIQNLTQGKKWLYVPSKLNPADVISRGALPQQLAESAIWWNGPSFLTMSDEHWPSQKTQFREELPETKTVVLISTSKGIQKDIITRFSTFNTLRRVTSYLLRFIHNCRVDRKLRTYGTLTNEEIERSTIGLVKIVQSEEFSTEIYHLKKSKRVNENSKLFNLIPFLDEYGIIRVGGRLNNAELSFNRKHPIIIPSKHHFTTLIVRYEHARNLHAGCQVVLSNIRNNFWPLNGRKTVRREIRACVVCFRSKPRFMTQLMGDLPSSRVNPSKPFSVSGVDYAGPYTIRDSMLRNRKLIKAYICIFVCFATKATHLELVSDLSSEGFLNAFKRFIARRGICSEIYSDNGSNFVGANRQLQECITVVKESKFQNNLTNLKIKWHFIPPRSPHFGGLWESAVRAAKFHIKRVVNNVHLTYEEFYTLLSQIESILNSRPLCQLTEDPDDLAILTPGHFLIGNSLVALPEPEVPEGRRTYTSRYNHLKLLMQHFWKKWSRNYLNTLQQRTKWRSSDAPEQLKGRVVILIEDNVPPQQWKLGRIEEVYPGKDNLVRVVSVKTSNNVLKRALSRICLLPIDV